MSLLSDSSARALILLAVLSLLVPARAWADPQPYDWNTKHGSRTYAPVRVDRPPVIDGVLDEPVWKTAAKESRFHSIISKPYGMPALEPTTVQIAYDAENLYVAFRCGYSKPGPRDDSVPPDEASLISADRVGVQIDARLDHSTGRVFNVARTGARADTEITNNGNTSNVEWRGIWDAATKYGPDSWTAEIKIPWGTVGLPAHDGDFEVGANFVRVDAATGEYSLWSLIPPTTSAAPSYYGHLTGMSKVSPSQRLYIQPYLAATGRQDNGEALSGLRDFTGTGGHVGTYGGFYARYRPAGPLQIDATMNPDFSTVSPDQAVANLDRFELSYPELRPFFSEDRARFEVGVPGGPQLFYTRRLGLVTRPSGAYSEVPILYGAKAVVRDSGTEVAAMNVAMSTADPRVTLADNVAVVRINHAFGQGDRIGNLLMTRAGSGNHYLATAIDGQYTMFDQRLALSGFYARSATDGAGGGGMTNVNLGWASQDFQAGVRYTDVTTSFDPQLGYVPETGVVQTNFYGAYTPFIANDLVRQLFLDSSVLRSTNRDDSRVYDRYSFGIGSLLMNNGFVSLRMSPSVEEVFTPFQIAAERITVPAGHYNMMVAQFSIDTPPRRMFEGHLGYTEGELFGGYRRAPNARVGLNVGRLSGSTYYELTNLRYGSRVLVAHRLSARTTFSYTPLARTTLIIEASTLTLRSIAQLVTSYTFGALSTVSLVVSESSGQQVLNLGDGANWYDHANFTAVLAFAYGFTPF